MSVFGLDSVFDPGENVSLVIASCSVESDIAMSPYLGGTIGISTKANRRDFMEGTRCRSRGDINGGRRDFEQRMCCIGFWLGRCAHAYRSRSGIEYAVIRDHILLERTMLFCTCFPSPSHLCGWGLEHSISKHLAYDSSFDSCQEPVTLLTWHI